MGDLNEPFPYEKQAEDRWKEAGEKRFKPGAGLRRTTVNPLDYHTPGPGKEGATASGRVSIGTKHLINIIVSSKQTPFDTAGELVRAAIVWYLNEIAPNFRNGRIAEGLKDLHDYIDDSARDALAINLDKMQHVSKDRITRLMRIGADRDAALAYMKMLRVAASSHPKFGRVMRQWAENDVAFEKIRPLIRAIEASLRPTDDSLCTCQHVRLEHDTFTKEGESTVVCRGGGMRKSGKGKSLVPECACEGFDWDVPPTEEEMDL